MRKYFSVMLAGFVSAAIVSGFALAASMSPTIVVSGQ